MAGPTGDLTTGTWVISKRGGHWVARTDSRTEFDIRNVARYVRSYSEQNVNYLLLQEALGSWRRAITPSGDQVWILFKRNFPEEGFEAVCSDVA